jgi:hypothetical protein
MNRNSFKLVLGQDPKAWMDRYGIQPFTLKCGCGADMTTSIPAFDGQLRALMAPPCACGNTDTPYCVVRDPKHGDLLEMKP